MALFTDYGLIVLGLIIVPSLVTFLLQERKIIPAALTSLIRTGSLRCNLDTARDLRVVWERRYRKFNVIGQTAGMVFGILVAIIWWEMLLKAVGPNWHFAHGAVSEPGKHHISVGGWVNIYVHIPVFLYLLSLFFFRTVTIIYFVRELVRRCEFMPLPFHPDGCGGMKPIGTIVLRIQYVVLSCGLCIFLMAVQGNFRHPEIWVPYLVFYLPLGPLCFLGPLLPLHRAMRKFKEGQLDLVYARLRSEQERIMSSLGEKGVAKEDQESIDRLKEMLATAARVPTWPMNIPAWLKLAGAYLAIPIAWLLQNEKVGQAICGFFSRFGTS
jgi:hypothetical protein